jgi:hypothetical protein
VGLHVIRTLTGLLLLSWLLLTYAGNIESLLSPQGWVDVQALDDAARLAQSIKVPGQEAPFAPKWSILYWCGGNLLALNAVFWASVGMLLLFTLGVYPRLTAVLTWVVVASFTANPAFEYEGDALLLILAFYLMVGYLLSGQRRTGLGWPGRLFGSSRAWPLRALERDESGAPIGSIGANLALRLIQVHFALVIVTSGLHKLQFGDWWAGVALWFPLHPPFKTTLADVLVNKPYVNTYFSLLNIATYFTLAWQIGFPLFAWRPRWRIVLLGGGAIGWLAGAFLWQLPLIGPAFLIACLSFVSPAGWHRVLGWLPRQSSQQSAVSSQQSEIKRQASVGAVS